MVNTEEQEVTELDLIYDSHDRIDALIELLIKKEVITQDEYNHMLDKIYENNED